MSSVKSTKEALRLRRKLRIRKKINGTSERPRLSIFKSPRHVYVQIIDDVSGHTLASASSFERSNHRRANVDVCKEIGLVLAARCKEKSIAKIVFDKSGYQYHGRIKAIADGAREGGLDF